MIFSLVAKRGEDVFLMGKRVVIKGPTNVELDVFLVSPTLKTTNSSIVYTGLLLIELPDDSSVYNLWSSFVSLNT